jgi:hypothetical protein
MEPEECQFYSDELSRRCDCEFLLAIEGLLPLATNARTARTWCGELEREHAEQATAAEATPCCRCCGKRRTARGSRCSAFRTQNQVRAPAGQRHYAVKSRVNRSAKQRPTVTHSSAPLALPPEAHPACCSIPKPRDPASLALRSNKLIAQVAGRGVRSAGKGGHMGRSGQRGGGGWETGGLDVV